MAEMTQIELIGYYMKEFLVDFAEWLIVSPFMYFVGLGVLLVLVGVVKKVTA